MRIFDKPRFLLPCIVALSVQAAHAQPPSLARSVPSKIGNVPVADIPGRLGAKLEQAAAAEQLDAYSSHFDRSDPNRDGRHTKEEFVDKGRYMTPQARAGIFRAADGNADGVVTKAEYVLNRIITDEAKTIVGGMDDDKDGSVERAEFVGHAAKLLGDPELAEKVYAAFDANTDGHITTAEYLRVWGQWARVGRKSAEERLAARRAELADVANKPATKPAQPGRGRPGGQTRSNGPKGIEPAPANCPACAMGLTAELVFKRLDVNEDGKIVVEAAYRVRHADC
ncbi:MAG: hypothetical protein V3R99_04115 [Thermoguttaceae bacterium]